MTETENSAPSVEDIAWLADMPLFIDKERIDQFYDAVLMPIGNTTGNDFGNNCDGDGVDLIRHKAQSIEIEVTEKMINSLHLEGGVKGSVSLGQLLSGWSGLPDFDVGAHGDLELDRESQSTESLTVEFREIESAPRQLVQLTLHYLAHNEDRIHFLESPSNYNWGDPERVDNTPRELIYIDFPGIKEAEEKGLIETRFVPTAAEFEDGIVPLYTEFGTNLPRYKEIDDLDLEDYDLEEADIANLDFNDIGLETVEVDDVELDDDGRIYRKDLLRASHRNYWQDFGDMFTETAAMRIVEEAAYEHGRINWIDFRTQLTEEGDSIHLHITPDGKYDTGVFAYNFIKRAHKHGIRIVGSLKKGSDLDVLAIYNK